ncbi:MAG: carboxypeptidase-like regulatory domain-containing protein, partial [Bacteroidales bacterium]|nr:carboxypeptidase-like regulatory domain-containing protein [Bacteroidales bacterium]
MRNKTTKAHLLPWGMLRVFVVLMAMMAAFAVDVSAQGTVKGKVLDEGGMGLPGANVFVKGTTIGTISDMDGNYQIPNVPSGEQTITASFIGYSSMEVSVNVSNGA